MLCIGKQGHRKICTPNFGINIQRTTYTRDRNVWGDRPFYLVKQPQVKWACDFRDDVPALSFQLQVAEVIF